MVKTVKEIKVIEKPKKNYVIIQEINKKLENHRNFIGYIDGRLNAFDGDLLVMKTRFEKTQKEYNENTKDLQNARTDTLQKIKVLETKRKNVGKKTPKAKPIPVKKTIIEKVKEIIKPPEPEPLPEVIIPKEIIEDLTVEEVIEGKTDIAEQMRDIADDLNGESKTIAYVCHEGWNDEFENLFPKKAIWQGQITQAFAEWLKENKDYG